MQISIPEDQALQMSIDQPSTTIAGQRNVANSLNRAVEIPYNNAYLNKIKQELIAIYSNPSNPDFQTRKIIANKIDTIVEQYYRALLQSGYCKNRQEYDNASLSLVNLNQQKISEISQYKQNESCLVKSIFAKDSFGGLIVASYPAYLFLTDIKQFGAESAFGNVMSLTYKTSTGNKVRLPFLVKSTKDPNDKSLHLESVIGEYINNLRSLVPNFVYSLGVTTCSPAINDPNTKNNLSFCDADGEVTYLVLEDLSPVTDLSKVCDDPNTTFNTWFNYYMQVAFALHIAHDVYDFTHYDLHWQNVLIKDMGKTIQYKINFAGTDIYIKSNALSIIIDLGRAHIKTKQGQHLGTDVGSLGIFPDRSFVLYDLYKLLMFSAGSILYSKRTDTAIQQMLGSMNEIFYYFNKTDNFQDMINIWRDNTYSLYSNFTDMKDASEFFNYVNTNQVLSQNLESFISITKYQGIDEHEFRQVSSNYNLWSDLLNANINITNPNQLLYLYETTKNDPVKQRIVANQIAAFTSSNNLNDYYQQLNSKFNSLQGRLNKQSLSRISQQFDPSNYNPKDVSQWQKVSELLLSTVLYIHDFQNYFQMLFDLYSLANIAGMNIRVDPDKQTYYNYVINDIFKPTSGRLSRIINLYRYNRVNIADDDTNRYRKLIFLMENTEKLVDAVIAQQSKAAILF